MPATVSPAARLQAAQQQNVLVGVRVRPEVRAAARVRAEEGYPYAEKCKLEALRLEDDQRASIECLSTLAESVARNRA